MKILHLSDLHIKAKVNEDTKNAHNLIVKIINKYQNQKEKIVVLVTGDIVDDGRKYQYKNARAAFALLSLPHLKHIKVLMCPGNHDLGLLGLVERKRNLGRYGEYLKQKTNFPTLHSEDGCHFIGLNSMQTDQDDPNTTFAQGELGQDQRKKLKNLIHDLQNSRKRSGDKIVVYLHHHPFLHGKFSLKLTDAGKFLNIVRGKIDALLFGHDHIEKRFGDKESKYGLTLASGKSTSKFVKMKFVKMKGVSSGGVWLPEPGPGKVVFRFKEITVSKRGLKETLIQL